MQHMTGLGPITIQAEEFYTDETGSPAEGRILAIKDFLENFLDYNQEELETLDIRDTKRSPKDDIVYFALQDASQVKEIHYRLAQAENKELISRDYIPPQYYERYIAIGKRAANLRAQNRNLKTQIRWGSKDLEIFTKLKNQLDHNQKPAHTTFNKENLKDFMGPENLPEFDDKKQWIVRREPKPRRKLNFLRKKHDNPAHRNSQSETQDRQGITRQHSVESRGEATKKPRDDKSSTEEEDEEMADPLEDVYETPTN